jgi:hypothetical protein
MARMVVSKQNYSILNVNSYETINGMIKTGDNSFISPELVDCIDIDTVPENVSYYKDGKFYSQPPEMIENQKALINKQLDDIDKKSIRDAEDLFTALLAKGILDESDVPYLKERKEQKQALREQLKTL